LRFTPLVNLGVALVASSVLAVALSGCTATTHADSPSTEPTTAFVGEVPDFTGPYSAQFANGYSRASTGFIREVLKDSEITDAEYAEMTSVFTSCLADQGITFGGFKPTGGFSTSVAPNGGDTHEIVDQCSRSSGEDSIGAIYNWVKKNPDNLDGVNIIKDCLIRKGVVPPDYSADEFAQDNAGRFGDLESLPEDLQAALVSCSSDPLGLLD